ncbi:hypothetical protein OHS59_31720 [Streptomyces sp. NBC_00414]|uniref:hypothetical protein n=1 Tax=Streptomyces sp. NBC_00414 TaxID=2975739 RepID=UPI002E1CEA9A
MTQHIERYTWEDRLIEAETLGLLPSGAVNMCLRLAKAINWKPGNHRKGMPSGLYWANEEALKEVNSSRATYFRYRKILFDVGFFTEIKGNLIPLLPVLSQIETGESHIETGESQTDTPYSEDTYTEDSSTEDTKSEKNAAVPAAIEAREETEAKEEKGSSVDSPLPSIDDASSLPLIENDAAGTADDDEEYEIELSPEIVGVLDGSTWPAKARSFFFDPDFQKDKKTPEERARWAGFYADAELEKIEKERANAEFAQG